MNTNMNLSPRSAAVIGALVADAAALGLHWLYDPKRIADIEKKKPIAFLSPDDSNYADTKGFYAHGGKRAGDSSGYGEACLLMLQHIAHTGHFDRTGYQAEYRHHFGPGGEYIGYIDSPTRQTLLKLIPLLPEEFPEQSGADDDQFAALATIPAITATHTGSEEELLKKIETAVRITNHNELAVEAAKYTGAVLYAVINGEDTTKALTQALQHAGTKLAPLVEKALQMPTLDSVGAAEQFGSACHVPEGVPVIAHIIRHTNSYQDAIEANIRAGGDSCGRAIMLGAISAAANCNDKSIPIEWLSKYRKLSIAADACCKI